MSRVRLAAGIVGPVLFTVATVVQGAVRPHFDPVRHLISDLALTSQGWLQTANFVVTGILVVVFATGLRRTIRDGPASAWGPRWIALAGLALVAAGLFTTDPGPDYPPGATPTTSWHGILHQIAGPLVFVSLSVTAFVYARRVARGWAVAAGILVALCFLVTDVLVTLAYSGTWPDAPAGLFESAALYIGLAWLTTLAIRTLRRPPATATRPG
ncbi:DUF998 domain-containing protein [Dactylosporangium sp. CS-047395]|uniref:DUF998 domain-containing protein n=1 Tax=Dactylosporangium sp. CS-047395 TaxID=3239936 RepID=UPI003D8E48DC